MSKSKKGKGGVAGGRKVRTASTAVESDRQGIAIYMELANAARNELARQKTLPVGIDIRLRIERDFCMNILVNICKLKQSYIQKLQREIHEDKEKFEEEVKGFCEAIVPKKKRGRVIISKDFKKEVAALTGRDRNIKKGGIIFP